MATLAKIFGVACMILAFVAVLDLTYRVLAYDWSAANDDSFGELGRRSSS